MTYKKNISSLYLTEKKDKLEPEPCVMQKSGPEPDDDTKGKE